MFSVNSQHQRFSIRRIQRARVRRGFSLTELMVVIVIIGLLAGAVAVGARAYMAAGRSGVARMEISQIVEALESYSAMKGRLPATNEGLQVLVESTDQFPGGLLKGNLNDPWGNPYEYVVPGPDGEPYEILCSGADGRIGTDDDISNTELGDE
ncbi:MAG: type II secretion system protein GspG [Planctomycetota bacterium]